MEDIKETRITDVLVPDENDDLDCYVISMQPSNMDGSLPQIGSVQGGVSETEENLIYSSDSISIYLHSPPPRLSPTINLNDVSIIPIARNNAPATSPEPRDATIPIVDLTSDNSDSDSEPSPEEPISQHKQTHIPPQKIKIKLSSIPLPFRCDLCPAQYLTMYTLNNHRKFFHNTTSFNIGIPLIDVQQPGIMQNLTSVGIDSVVPVSNSNNTLAVPVVSRNAARNLSLCDLSTMGARSLLSLGPVRSLPKNQGNNGTASNVEPRPL